MPVHEEQEFERLLAAHAGGTLADHDKQRLEGLAAELGRSATVAGVDTLLTDLAAERTLRQECAKPWSDDERRDMVAARLRQKAQEEASALAAGRVRRPRRGSGRMLLAAAVLVGVLITARAMLVSNVPDDLRLHGNGAMVVDTSQVGSGLLSWPAVPGATSYDAALVDGDGVVIARRPATQAQSTEWQLGDATILARLRDGKTRLRVSAVDASGIEIAHSRDVPVRTP